MKHVVRFLLVLAVLAALPPATAHADGAQPAYLALRETESRRFEVVWRVPWHQGRILSIHPVLPERYEEIAPHEREITAAGLHERWSVQAPPGAGKEERIEVRGVGAALAETLVRFRFLDGTTTTRVLSPGSPSCRMPRARSDDSGTGPAWPRTLQSGTWQGVRHLFSAWGHLLLLAALWLCTSRRSGLQALGALLLGQLVGLGMARGLGWSVPAAPTEALFGVAAALLLAQRLREGCAVRLAGMFLGLGMLHGIALGAPGGEPNVAVLGQIIGMDLGQILLLLFATLLPISFTSIGARRIAYGLGSLGIALALATITAAPRAQADAAYRANLSTLVLDAQEPGRTSQALTQGSGAPIQLFVQTEPERLRIEVLLRLSSLPGGSGSEDVVPIDAQAALQARASVWALSLFSIRTDRRTLPLEVDSAYFVSTSTAGVLERETPVPEERALARLGVSLSTPLPPRGAEISVRLLDAPESSAVPLTIVEEGGVRTETLEPPEGSLTWSLKRPPPETVASVERRSPRGTLPLVPAAVALSALVLLAWGWRRQRAWTFPAGRLLVGLACLSAPFTPLSIPLPDEDTPPPSEVEAVSEALLSNVYRALSVREEAAAYDRLAVSVIGSLREKIYLEQRQALDLEGRGGARARVESVEVQSVEAILPIEDGFTAEVRWTAAGSVVHFGHRHMRRNNYRARLNVVAEEGAWKISDLEILELERLR